MYPSQLFNCPANKQQKEYTGAGGLWKAVANQAWALYDKRDSLQDKTNLAACMIRMAGHDLMDFRWWGNGSTYGGSDGCINFEDSDNKGLPKCLAESGFTEVFEEYCQYLSLADF